LEGGKDSSIGFRDVWGNDLDFKGKKNACAAQRQDWAILENANLGGISQEDRGVN